MHNYLGKTKRNDDIAPSPNSKGGLRNRENHSSTNNKLGPISRKKQSEPVSAKSSKSSLLVQMKKQGMQLTDSDVQQGTDWLGRLSGASELPQSA